MKIGKRLTLGFSLILILLSVVALLGVARLSALNETLIAAVDFNGNENNLIAQALDSAQEASSAMKNIIILTDEPRMRLHLKSLERHLAEYLETEKKMHTLFSADPGITSKERDYLAELVEVRTAVIPALQKAVALGLKNDPDAAEVMINETIPALEKWTKLLNELRVYEVNASNEEASKAHDSFYFSRVTLLSISGLAILLGILISFSVTRTITRPLARAVQVAETIASGDLTCQIRADRDDEVGKLLAALQLMNESLKSVVNDIRISSDAVAGAAKEVASGNIDLSSRTEQQAASIEETVANIANLSAMVAKNADNSRQANSLAANAAILATSGNEAVQSMVSTIKRISSRSDEISEITGVIESIAFQTNILALNASVEAARAGDQGRGFAVVAGEVRNLAQRASSSAKDIKELLSTSTLLVQGGVKQATDAGITIEEVKHAIQQMAQRVNEISSSTIEQRFGIEQIHKVVDQMEEVTQQNAALVEQAAAAAQSLESQSRSLSETIAVFKIEDRHVLQPSAEEPFSPLPNNLQMQIVSTCNDPLQL